MDPSTSLARIVLDPAVCQGRPIIRGTRLTVETVLSYLSTGDSIEEVLEAHPRLTREDGLPPPCPEPRPGPFDPGGAIQRVSARRRP